MQEGTRYFTSTTIKLNPVAHGSCYVLLFFSFLFNYLFAAPYFLSYPIIFR